MLGKLLKYEIKAFGRIMLPLYGIAMVIAVIFATMMRLSMNGFAKFLLDKFAVISGFLFIIVMMAVMVVMVVMIVQRFYRNLLGTEGYLMFTLPATTLDNILSKGITAVIWILIGGVCGTIAGFASIAIISDLDAFLRQFYDVLSYLKIEEAVIRNIALLCLLILFGLVASLCKIYASIAIGHQLQDHRLFGAVAAFIDIGIIEVLITSLPGVRSLLGTNQSEVSYHVAVTTGIIISVLQILIYGAITWWLLDRRLNLE